uniref:Uncharacterized protein n=1 Tax=viral metagenome TaxID=1070528 RepID=A0A6M3JRS5_9ZZZZ
MEEGLIVIPVENENQAKALAFFLAKERNRHLKDICAIDKDLNKLEAKWGIRIPNPPAEVWVEI